MNVMNMNAVNMFPILEERKKERAANIVSSLKYLEREAIDAAFPELAMLIGVAALAAQEIGSPRL